MPEHLLNYFDYEGIRAGYSAMKFEEDGHFAPGGYVLNNGGKFIEALPRDRGHSRRAQGFRVPAALGAGADGGLQSALLNY